MFCHIDGLDVYYESYGEGTPIVNIHGFGIDHHVMTGCMEPILKDRPGWQRIYLDLPGMGQTKPPEWLKNSDQMLDVVVQFCDKVLPGQSFLVAGESYGGYLARGLVYRMPERLGGVLLICPVVIANPAKRDRPYHTVFFSDEKLLSGIDPADRRFFERMVSQQDEKRWKRFRQDILTGRRVKDEAFLSELKHHGYDFSFDVDRIAQPFDKPSLVLAGRQDASVGFKDTLRLIDNYTRGTFAILDRASHSLEVEQEEVFNTLVLEWLDRVKESQK